MPQINLKQIQAYHQHFPEESATIEALEYFLQHQPQNKHSIIGSAWIINPQNGKVLLQQNSLKNTWEPISSEAETNDKKLPLIQAITAPILAKSGLKAIEPISEDPLNIRLCLNKNTEKPYYFYNFCYLFMQANKQEEHMDGSRWINLVELLTAPQFATVKPLAKKWQLMHFSDSIIED